MKKSLYGFTLIELLVAIAIFAVMAAIAYGGLSSVIQQRERNDAVMDRLRTVQQAISIITRDLSQLQPRSIRDGLGDARLGALVSMPQNLPPVEFTRGGWMNPLVEVRSTEQRVAYELDNAALVRISWPELDRSVQTLPVKQTLLTDVTALQVQFLDSSGQWQNQWPPLNANTALYLARLPRAVNLRITLKDLGAINRIVELASP